MSFGDEIMASGHARVAVDRAGPMSVAVIIDKFGRPRWNDLWFGLPFIQQRQVSAELAKWDTRNVIKVVNGPGARPYIAYPFTRQKGQRWTKWRANDHVGRIELKPIEIRYAVDHIGLASVYDKSVKRLLIEPNVARDGNPNKQWGKTNWLRLVKEIKMAHPGIELFQVGSDQKQMAILGDLVRFIQTPTFRHGAAVLNFMDGAILPEGGLHHAAAALGKKAVVLFGPCTSPSTTGYDTHINIADDHPKSPCGSWVSCEHCRQRWTLITVDTVMNSIERLVDGAGAVGPPGAAT